MPVLDTNKVISMALTTGDIAQPASYENILFTDVNIHVYGADVYYGDGVQTQQAVQSSATPTCSIIRTGGVVWFEKCYINQIFFKSYVNATPGYITITGTV